MLGKYMSVEQTNALPDKKGWEGCLIGLSKWNAFQRIVFLQMTEGGLDNISLSSKQEEHLALEEALIMSDEMDKLTPEMVEKIECWQTRQQEKEHQGRERQAREQEEHEREEREWEKRERCQWERDQHNTRCHCNSQADEQSDRTRHWSSRRSGDEHHGRRQRGRSTRTYQEKRRVITFPLLWNTE